MGDHAADHAQDEHLSRDREALEAGRLLFASPCRFFHAAQRASELPRAETSEVAFAGRSNVGKSSLINALTGRRALARVSKAPGRTQQLNFFALGPDARGRRLTLVDMPGYGFARVSKALRGDWSALIGDYLRGRAALARVVVLVDARHGPKPHDRALFELLDEAAQSWQLALTKCDALLPAELAARIEEARAAAAAHRAAHPAIIATSAETGSGIPELRAALAALAAIG